MQNHIDPTYLTFLTNGACAVRGRIPVRMLQITPQRLIGLDVNVNNAQHHSRTTYANDVKIKKFDAGPTSILNIGCAILLVELL